MPGFFSYICETRGNKNGNYDSILCYEQHTGSNFYYEDNSSRTFGLTIIYWIFSRNAKANLMKTHLAPFYYQGMANSFPYSKISSHEMLYE